ncbi:type I-E CRISPR-associated protein Cas7/Cse4/CasC [soil metagenome]
MKLIELHILQSFPVSCLNRDDMNSPKTATFGGVQRARVSSQCWKRAIRETAAASSPHFRGERTRLIVGPLRDALQEKGFAEPDAKAKAIEIAEALATYDKENEKKNGTLKVKTIFFTSPAEIEALATAFAETKDVKKTIKALKPEHLKDAADVTIFGRMVAADHSLTLEGAGMFSHALSTHRVDNEIDFFTAVDDRNPTDDSGSGHMGTTEFNAATYYRFVALNLSMLADQDHLAAMSPNERKEVVAAFIEATLRAVPNARKNSMNADTPVDYVLGVVKEKGQPVQLVNAFEKAVRGSNGLSLTSARELLFQRQRLNRFFGGSDAALATGMLQPAADSAVAGDGQQLAAEDIPEWVNLPEFVERLTAHVL